MKRATIFDVAERAGVSIKTVSRVINNEPNVREATEARVRDAIKALNFRPDQAARNLAAKRSHLIVLVYDDPSNYELPSSGYIIEMQQGMLRACRSGFSELLIHPCDYQAAQTPGQLVQLIEQAKPTGIVLAAPLSNVAKIVDAINGTGTTCVLLSPGIDRPGQPSVATNDREVSAEMTRHLASLGHRRIAFIEGNPSHQAVVNRALGYADGLEQSGIAYSRQLVLTGDNTFGAGEKLGEQLLRRKHPPTAIFAANDDMAVGVIRAADRLGVRVPQQVSVAGFDDIALARQIYPSLTTIHQPLDEMAEHAATLLLQQRRVDCSAEASVVIPATVRVRESTGPVPGD